jgi:dTDP-4-amino-4,6-dideoxygalactose transaminase
MGPRTEELESALAGYTGARHSIAVSSGTAALHLAYLAAGIGPGDRVAMPSLTFVATANAASYTGAAPAFGEIKSLAEPWLDPVAAEAALEQGASAIVTVAYGGHLGETEALAGLAARRGVPLIEDAAHACGSRAGGRHAGTFGTAAALSFFSNKNLGIGEGGAVITDDQEAADRVRRLRTHGMSSSSWDRHRRPGGGYEVVELGFNYRLDEGRAALALRRLQRLEEENRQRREIDAAYRRSLEGLAGVTVTAPVPAGASSSHHLFTIVLDEAIERDRFRRLLAEQGVETSVHYPPVHLLGVHARDGARLPLTEAYASRTVSLPIFPHMEDWQQELVIEAVAGAPGRLLG